ncbi:MAG: transglutaminase family protein [Verrucomicrobia bacterium]|nr:transglutaminase family protein [Verrucomicrobiota bacterium]NBU08960.1 transglutaminase family protein [Pseudomonadota bacterium]NDA65457.1 transglutaminase family protein [Verrucomicrobiota bacterium]NDB74092.1 transglutaminase family protein [Verrucomicrobiota bacterium]NDD37167.1 transglutaminase family protein [Verrucomicrobiota bacterium]
MKWDILHRTRFSYASPVRDSFNEVRLQPPSNDRQTVESFLLKVLPAARLRHYADFYHNTIHHFEIPEPHSSLMVDSQCRVTTRSPNLLADNATPFPLARIDEALRWERSYDFLQPSRFVDTLPQTWRLALDVLGDQQDTWQAALALMRFVHTHLTYVTASTHVHTHMQDVLTQRRGVCQDFAHVLLGLCRAVKIPACYVSGYLATEAASATHAWTEVLIPGIGWRALDPTHNCQPDECYVKIAVGRDYADVAPVSGHYVGNTQRSLEVSVQIRAVE